jgi:hypothetical protein
MREFGAQQHDLRRVIDPDQQNNERGGRAIGRSQRELADINADQQFTELEQRGGDRGAEPDIAPFHRRVGHQFEHDRKHRGDGGERDDQARGLQHRLRQLWPEILFGRRQRSRECHRNQQQKTDADPPMQ